MGLLKKSKNIVCMLITSILVGCNAVNMHALNYNKFPNINIDMPSVIGIDEKSGDVLYAQNEKVQRPIASLTKSMTLLLVLDAIERGELSLDEVIELQKDPDSWGSRFYLKKGDKYTVKDYLEMIMIISANDACIVMAEKVSGTVEEFVKLMNARAKELGMKDTIFYNPNGLPLGTESGSNPGNLSTAKDLAVLVKYIMNVYGDDVKKFVSSEKLDLEGMENVRYNSNKLLFRQELFDGYTVDGFKTGYTDEARFCLITTSEHYNDTPDDTQDDYRVIGVTLGGQSSEHRFEQHTKLLNYIQDTYINEKILSKNETVKTLDEYNSEKYKIDVVAQKDVYSLIKKGEPVPQFSYDIKIKNNISYPVYKGDTMGIVTLVNQDNPELKYSVGLISKNPTKEVSLFDRVFRRIK